MSSLPQEYYLEGRFKYRIYYSKFDGWDYKFPVLDPVRMENIMGKIDPRSVPHSKDGRWLDIEIVPEQRQGYFSWTPTDNFVLNMRLSHSCSDDKYAYVGRFSYEPESQEFLMGRLDQKHAETI